MAYLHYECNLVLIVCLFCYLFKNCNINSCTFLLLLLSSLCAKSIFLCSIVIALVFSLGNRFPFCLKQRYNKY